MTILEDFDSRSNSDFESLRRKQLRNITKQKEVELSSHHDFYVGQTFGSKADVKKLIEDHAIETRRNILQFPPIYHSFGLHNKAIVVVLYVYICFIY